MKKQKSLLKLWIIIVVAIFIAAYAAQGLAHHFYNNATNIRNIQIWLHEHRALFYLIWHPVLLLAVFFLWPIGVKYRVSAARKRGEDISEAMVQKLINRRWHAITFLIIFDIVLYIA